MRFNTDTLTDPVLEDEENPEGSSIESPSTQNQTDLSVDIKDDIENQRRALSEIDASTSSIKPIRENLHENIKKEITHLSKIRGNAESQSITDGRYGILGDSTIDSQAGHSGEMAHSAHSPLSSVESPAEFKDPSEEVVEVTKSTKKERSSWDFEADDTFKFESEGPIPEPEKLSDPPSIFSPSFVRSKNDFRAKLIHLSELTLPLSPSGLELETLRLPPDDYEQLQQEASSQENMVGDVPPLSSRKKPPRPVVRPKTRLQDPPPMALAVSDQLASLRSDSTSSSRRASIAPQPMDDEGQTSKLGSTSNGRPSIVVSCVESEPLQSRSSRKSMLLNPTESLAIPMSEKPPEKTSSRLGMFSPSVIFSGSRMALLSRSKASIQQLPAPPTEEEADPLDDDSIPRYKKYRSKDCRWLVWIQWISLFILIVMLILGIKLNKLQMVIWKEIQLWQWLALATVIISGRLIAGWSVMIMVALIERHYILKKRVLYFVYGLRHAVKNVVWLALVIGVWKLVFRHMETQGNIQIVTKVLWCLFTTACLWMAKILAVKVAANSFHRAAYFDRVQDCLFHQYVLETLSAPSKTLEKEQISHSQDIAVEPQQFKQSRQELETLLHPDVLDPDSSSEIIKPMGEPLLTLAAPQLPQLSQHESENDKRATPTKSVLRAVLESRLDQTISPEGERISNLTSGVSRSNLGSSITSSTSRNNLTGALASPSYSNLTGTVASQSRSNLGSTTTATPHQRRNLRGESSRAKLGTQEAPILLSPTGSRLRRVTGADIQTSSILARNKSPIQQEKLQELTAETVSAWTMKRLMKIIRKTNIATFSSILDQEAGEKIDSEAQAKAAAKQIFYNIARPGEKYLTLTDFFYFLPEDQATRAFALFEVNDQGQITKKALMKWVVNIYKERRALALTLSDNRTVVAKLHRVLDVLLIAVAITICFLIMGVNTQKLIVGFSSVLLPSVFVFGNAARSTFESLIFLFVMHPFDVGDRICVDGNAMIVEEMNILNTILLSGSNEKIYYPNSVLATKAISNYYRSPDQWDAIEFQIHATTPIEQLGLLKERMTKYIESLPQFWYPVFRMVCKDIEDSTRMKMALWVQHHLNYQESGERWQRRSNMILHMKKQLEDLGISFHLPRQEITVTGIPILDIPTNHSRATPI